MTEPHYETLELRVPEEPIRIVPPTKEDVARARKSPWYLGYRYGYEAGLAARPSRRWIYLAVLFTALLIVVIAQLASAPSGASEPPSTAPALRGAPVSWVAQWQSTGGRIGRPEVAGSNPALGTAGAPLRGYASWYDVASGHAAAGPLLRTGDWRERAVTVCAGRRCVTVVTDDWCACGSRHGIPTLIDLARSDFARLAPPSSGIVLVTVSGATLPATDMEPSHKHYNLR